MPKPLRYRDPNKPETPQEKKDIDRIKKNLKKKPLTPKQKKLDVNKDGVLEASDFKALRKKKPVDAAMTGGQIVSMMYDD